jgi:adenosylhomocysteine nucleosidase
MEIVMETIGILAAMSEERDALLRFVEGVEYRVLDPFRCHRFHMYDRDCWLLTSGMGLKRAEQAAHALIEAVSPQLLVSVGVAGAVKEDLEIGDVVASRNTCRLDHGLPGPFQPLALLSETAWQAAKKALQPRRVRLYWGTAITTRGSQVVHTQPGEMENPFLEMETEGIARVAMRYGIPLLSLRAISDGPRAPNPFDLEVVMDEEYNLRMRAIFKTILCHPQMIPQFLRMRRNTKIAAENAALALVAALSQPGPVISL